MNKEVNAYVNGELVMRDLLGYALKQKSPAKILDDVKKEMREHFPNVEFRVEKIKKKLSPQAKPKACLIGYYQGNPLLPVYQVRKN